MSSDGKENNPLSCCGVTPWGFEIDGNYGLRWYRLICPKCGLHFTAPTKSKAIKRWNNRVVTDL